MKKYLKWPVIAAVLSAALFKDPCSGPFLGLLVGFIIGVPVFYILASLFGFFTKSDKKVPRIIAVWLSILLVIVIHWFLFKPPAWFLFSMKLAYPIPESVTHLESKSSVAGVDGSHYLWFNISKKDLDKIILNKNYQPTQKYEFRNDKDGFTLDLFSSDTSFCFSFSDNFPWYGRIKEITNPEVFIRDNIQNGGGTLEYIIYNPNQSSAFYELSTR
jgi:hypothetical protein